jgi:hypothetical protein
MKALKNKMKITVLFLFFTAALLPASARSEGGCLKGQEACSASHKKSSSFLEAVETAGKGIGKGKVTATSSSNLPPNSSGRPAKAVMAGTSTFPTPLTAVGEQGGLSEPAWLLLVGGGLAALYYYLKEGNRKGRKK